MYVSISEVRALVNTSLTDDALQTVIDREEGWLAGRIGPLVGPRTETLYPGLVGEPVYLPRRTTSVVVTDNGVAIPSGDIRFSSSGAVRWIKGYWYGPVTVTYTPNDVDAVRSAIIDLVRGRLADTGYESETIGDYSYTRGPAGARMSREAIARSLLVHPPVFSVRLRSSLEPG